MNDEKLGTCNKQYETPQVELVILDEDCMFLEANSPGIQIKNDV